MHSATDGRSFQFFASVGTRELGGETRWSDGFPDEPLPPLSEGTVAIVGASQSELATVAAVLQSLPVVTIAHANFSEFSTVPAPSSLRCILMVGDGTEKIISRLPRALRDCGMAPGLVVLARKPVFEECVKAVRAGATSYLPLFGDPAVIRAAVQTAIEDCRQAHEEIEDRKAAREAHSRLTKKEREVLGLLVRGYSNRRIGAELGAAEATVKIHRRRVLAKMGVRSLVDLVGKARLLPESITLTAAS